MNGIRQADLCHGGFQRSLRIFQRIAVGEIERDSRGRCLPLMGYRQRCVGAAEGGKRRQRHLITRIGHDIQLMQDIRIAGVVRRQVHDHVILVQRFIDRGNLPLAERIVEQRVNHLHVHAQLRGTIPVDIEHDLLTAGLCIGIHTGQLRQFRQRFLHLRSPFPQHRKIVRLQTVLILRVGAAPADMQILRRHQEQLRARLLAGRHHQTVRHLIGGRGTFVEIFQTHEERGGIT